jgi:hypothetical protein
MAWQIEDILRQIACRYKSTVLSCNMQWKGIVYVVMPVASLFRITYRKSMPLYARHAQVNHRLGADRLIDSAKRFTMLHLPRWKASVIGSTFRS